MPWYNGFTDAERIAKNDAGARARIAGTMPASCGPCMLCGDPEADLEPHSEDYSAPYSWEPPAVFWICRHCHRDKLHKRFARPDLWRAFVAHVRRGGYARDLMDSAVRAEFEAYRLATSDGRPVALRVLRTDRTWATAEWFELLTVDPASMMALWARPRREQRLSA